MIAIDATPAIGAGADFGCVVGRRRIGAARLAAPAFPQQG
jgi:hypothetical protein